MAELDVIENKIDRLLESQAEIKADVHALHTDHQQLKLDVTALPLKMYERADTMFVRLARYVVLERVIYGFLVSVVLTVVGYGIKVVLAG